MTDPYDRIRWQRDEQEDADAATRQAALEPDELEDARENVFDGWPSSEDVSAYASRPRQHPSVPEDTQVEPAPEPFATPPEPEAAAPEVSAPAEDEAEEAGAEADEPRLEAGEEPEPVALVDPDAASHEHAPGELEVPPGFNVLEGTPDGARRAVGVVVSRFNGEITSRLLESALDELARAGVSRSAITVMPVPGAFELPIGAMALARTRRFACIVALGCVVRGDTPHFDYVAGEAASGLQLAALETGVPVAFGVLTLDRASQAESRIGKGAEAVRTALEMADLFSHLRAAAAR
ncbi:MAG TPA: 6,7-dimethyl-8-ribityllumazine synthase [Gaiellaceae bacterium]|nr:6,7-dimethyl-8-ribityllumazine synthase [Gaiellaceae bacterium]